MEVRELARVAGSLDGKGALHFGPQATCVESRPVWEESQDPASEVPEERMTLVLFRTRRRDECSRLKEGVRRRVRKSRQKEAAGAADAGLMQIEWSERGG